MIPWHPLIVHLPLALSFLLPPLVLTFALFQRKKRFPGEAWFVIVGLQILLTVSGYIALETGENDEALTKTILESRLVNEHEEAAEIFVGSTVITLVLGIAVAFLQASYVFRIQIIIFLLGLMSCYFAYDTGLKGGELVYVHGAAEAFHPEVLDESEAPSEGILPTPGIETSESSGEEINESLEVDETEYGNADDIEVDEESGE